MKQTVTTSHCAVVAASIAALAAASSAANAESIAYDIQWNGPQTSAVHESRPDGSWSFDYPINGSIAVNLGMDEPSLVNIDSTVLLAPHPLPTYSPLIWHFFDLLEGQYVATKPGSDVSMVFRPRQDAVMPLTALYVELSDALETLTLTGGVQAANTPWEHDVAFAVSGKASTANDSSVRVPEPSAAGLVAAAALGVIASQRRR